MCTPTGLALPQRGPIPPSCHPGRTNLDDCLQLHAVVDVGVGGRGLHRLQPSLVHWGRRDRRAWVAVWPAGGPPASCHPHNSPKSKPGSQAANWSSSCFIQLLSFFGVGHCSGGRGAAAWGTASSHQTPIRSQVSGSDLPPASVRLARMCAHLSLGLLCSLSSYRAVSLPTLHISTQEVTTEGLLDPQPGSRGPMPP